MKREAFFLAFLYGTKNEVWIDYHVATLARICVRLYFALQSGGDVLGTRIQKFK